MILVLDARKMVEHLVNNCESTNSDKDIFINDLLILIESGQFEADDELIINCANSF